MYNQADFISNLRSTHTSGDTYEREVRDMGKNTVIVIDFAYDDDPDTSYLGHYTDKFEEWSIDRREGILYGELTSKGYVYKTRSESRAIERAEKRARKDGFQLDPDSEHCAESFVSRDGEYYTVTYEGHIIARSDIPIVYDRNEYKYWTAESYSAQDYTTDPEYIDYAIQDYKRHTDYNLGYWGFTRISITVYYKGIEVGTDSCGGFENDDNEYIKTSTQDMIDGLDVPALVHDKRRALLTTARLMK